jgi:hypothetical protein
MRTMKVLKSLAVLLVAFLAMGSHCPLVPEVEERTVELAVAGATSVQFHAQGEINVIDETESVDVTGDLDVLAIVEDAGIDVSEVEEIKVSGVSYRVVKKDPSVDRQINGGTVTIARAAGPTTPTTPLITNFNEGVNFVESYKTAPVDPAGITLINGLLADLLAEAKGGPAATNTVLTYRIQGNSIPSDETTDFIWEVKLHVSMVGEVHVDVID